MVEQNLKYYFRSTTVGDLGPMPRPTRRAVGEGDPLRKKTDQLKNLVKKISKSKSWVKKIMNTMDTVLQIVEAIAQIESGNNLDIKLGDNGRALGRFILIGYGIGPTILNCRPPSVKLGIASSHGLFGHSFRDI
jgi:hypothetical protein